ncbi:hypothetical protein B1748_35205 [Paenibacillus sp. MY03]|uniref:sugar-binding protein n=1 Tax=Paenibacillus sp. MY03 TaxID=302980 RepID=UPI000B3C762A|nr:sugar-binding protein [Paenibacillus sp. MY03]OUS67936.1 hypothetical protein B1748_35205 [Paenibacillus sp. MY03]
MQGSRGNRLQLAPENIRGLSQSERRHPMYSNALRKWLSVSIVLAMLASFFHGTVAFADIDNNPSVSGWNISNIGQANAGHSLSTSEKKAGSHSLHLYNESDIQPNVFYLVMKDVPVEPGADYTLSLWAKGENVKRAFFGGNNGSQTIRNYDLSELYGLTYDWTEFEQSFTAQADQTTFGLVILVEDRTDHLWIDEVSIVKNGTTENLVVNGGFEVGTSQVTANPPAGNVFPGTEVVLTASSPDANIRYTLDGSDPWSSDTAMDYTAPITIHDPLVIHAYAANETDPQGALARFEYTTMIDGESWQDLNSYLGSLGTERKIPILHKMNGSQLEGNWEYWSDFTGASLPADITSQVQMTGWNGAGDASAQSKFAYDEDGFYVAVQVQDDIHHSVENDMMWSGDSVQFAFTPNGSSYGPEYGLSLDPNGEAKIWRWAAGQAAANTDEVEFHVSRSGNYTYYEARLPWATIYPVSAIPEGEVRFSFLVNDNDGSGRKGWIEWTASMGFAKYPSTMSELQLMPEGDQWTVLLDGPREFPAHEQQIFELVIPNFGDEDIQLNVTSSLLGLNGYPVAIPANKVWKKQIPLTLKERKDHTAVVTVQSSDGQTKSDQLHFKVTNSPSELTSRAAALGERLGALEEALAQAKAINIPVDYEKVNYTVVSQFIPYVMEDIEAGLYERASYQLGEMERLYEEALEDVQAYLAGTKQPKPVNRYITGDIEIDRTSFIADTKGAYADDKVRKEVFFTGYGHFEQVRKDIPNFFDYGANIIQVEVGPSYVMKPPHAIPHWDVGSSGQIEAKAVKDREVKHSNSSGALRISNQTTLSPQTYLRLQQNVTIKPNTEYTIEAWVKGKNVQEDAVWFPGGPGWMDRQYFPSGDYDWTKVSHTYTSGEEEQFSFVILTENLTENLWIDDLRMYETNDSSEVNVLQNPSFDDQDLVDLGREEYAGELSYMYNDILPTLQRAAENNVAVNLLLSPHYFPDFLFKLWPDIASSNDNPFLRYTIYDDRAKQFIKDYLRLVVPLLKDSPALHSITLSNEGVYQSYRDEANKPLWQNYLQKQYDVIADLNAVHGTNYTDFGQIPLPTGVSRTPAFYDWVQFNNDQFSGWHQWMADIIHEIMPDIPVNAKIMNGTLNHINNWTWGVDAEQFSEFTQINGNDNANVYLNPENGFTYELKFYDLQTSLKEAPVFNSENHLIKDGEDRYIPQLAKHVRTSLWQGAIHGMSATTMWVWERTYEQNSDFKGSVMHRPDAAAIVGQTGLDLNRLSGEVTAFQQEKPDAAILYSVPSLIYSASYPNSLESAYEAISYNGLRVGFASENQIKNNGLDDLKVLFVPEATHIGSSSPPFANVGARIRESIQDELAFIRGAED